MAEYIEREALLKILSGWLKDDGYLSKDELNAIDSCKAQVEEQAAADVVDVVRCKDCKHGWENSIDGFIYCHRDGRRTYEMLFKPESFCSYGERKDGAE